MYYVTVCIGIVTIRIAWTQIILLYNYNYIISNVLKEINDYTQILLFSIKCINRCIIIMLIKVNNFNL